MKSIYCLYAIMLAVATISEVYSGKCEFMCLRKAIRCKRQKKDYCCEEFKKCGLEKCGEPDLRCEDKRGSWNKRYYNDFELSQEEDDDMSLPYF
ncbi:Hypothetical predicted protein [Mytilus galloprovincialis]|uniref:Uncharacterized protein n=1 Tax=Mytilus galloprovincialis TaxID=29158 RepID=A0A8B6HAG2_MYTGA|nr:Hypothetical predicted protein [Mytilus galloprovincialis]